MARVLLAMSFLATVKKKKPEVNAPLFKVCLRNKIRIRDYFIFCRVPMSLSSPLTQSPSKRTKMTPKECWSCWTQPSAAPTRPIGRSFSGTIPVTRVACTPGPRPFARKSCPFWRGTRQAFFVQNRKTQSWFFKNSEPKNLQKLSFCQKVQFQNSGLMKVFTKNCSKTTISDILCPKTFNFLKTQFQSGKN